MTESGPPAIATLGMEQAIRRLPAAAAIVDVSGRVLHANPRAEALTARLGESMPDNVEGGFEIWHLDGRRYEPQDWPVIRSISSGEEVVDEEYFHVLPDGAKLVIRASSSPIFEDDGRIVGATLVMVDITEQKLREDRMGYLAEMLEGTGDAIVGLDPEWFVTIWNKGAERMYGWTADEVLGRHTLEVAKLELSYEERGEMRATVAEEGSWRGEIVAYRKDGSPVVVELAVNAVREQSGELKGFLGIHRDMTERRLAEEKLAEARRRSATILESISDAFIAVDSDWRYVYVNDRALRRIQRRRGKALTREDILGKVMWDMFPEVVGTESHRKYHEAMRERRAVEFESYFAPSGEWFEARAYPSDGGLAIYYREVSEGKRAEYQMREAKAVIFESITDAFFLLDSDWRFAYVNERALHEMGALLGEQLERGAFVGQSLWEVFPAVLGTETEANFRRAVRDRQSILYEYLYPGSRSWFEVHAYPSDEGLSVYFRSIDDRKRAERDREGQARQQEAVARLGVKGLASDDLQSLMDEAVELVAERLGVELSSIGRLLPGGRRQVLAAGVGWGSGAVGSATAPAGPGSLIGYTIATGAPVLSDDLAADDRFFVSPLLTGRGVVSAAHVLIPGRERPFGTLGAFAKQRRVFSAADVSFLQAVANVISTAVERADVEERVNEVRETERRRIARDLHDDALRDLTHALAVASRDESLGELVAALKRVGQQLRGAIYDLRLTGEQDRTLLELLTEMVELHRAMAPELEIRVDRGEALPSGSMGDRGTEILRILSEAITNARRHSGASIISVDIAATDGILCFDVSDDGSGAALAEAVTGGGRGMIERADLLGAQLEVEAIPGGGTTVSLRLPVGEALEGAVERTCVLLVEDHTSVREAMAAAFEREPDFEVVGQAASLAEARLMLGNIDVALIDLGLPDGYGADLIAELREANPSAQALVLSASLDRADLARAVQKGAAGALNKNVHLHEVVDAVRRLRSGETLLPMQEVVELLRYAGRREAQRRDDLAAIERLTPREREVLQGLADGLDSRQIAEALHITLRTQRNHVASILSKLGVHSQLQALILALRYEVVQIS